MKGLSRMIVRFLVSACGIATLCYGQAVSGTITGLVTDPDGSAVPGAGITALSIETGIARTVSSNNGGNYSIPFLNPGIYNIEVSHQGFKTFVQENVTVQVGSTIRLDARLALGDLSQKLVVSAAPPLLQTESGGVASTLNQREMQELPSLDRNYQDLISLLPGTGRPEPNFTDIGPDDTHLTSVNGLEKYTNNYEIDGIDNNDVTLGNTFQVPPIGSIQEVHVATSDYDAEFGRAGGAVVSVQTRSGTNQLHGSLYEFHRDSFLRARRAFPEEDSPAKNVHNLYGVSVGGPIRQDRTFFFADFQGVNDRQNVAQLLSAPIPSFRNGDFSSVLGKPLGVTDPAGQMIYSGSIFDPLSGNPDGSARQVFPGNKIPASRFNPQANKMISLLPMPNIDGEFTDNYSILVPTPRDTYAFDGRVDHTFSPSTSVFGKYNFRQTKTLNFSSAGAALRPDGFLNGLGHLRAQTVSLNLTHTFSANTVSEIRFGVNRYHYDYTGQNESTAADFGIEGLAPDAPLPQISFYDGTVTSIGFSPYYPLVNNQTTYQLSNTWTKTNGKHNLKWGVDYRHMNLYRASRSSNTGTFVFYNDVTRGLDDTYVDLLTTTPGDTFAAFLLGLPDQVTRNTVIQQPVDLGDNLFLFGQDTWRPSPNLTLNFGVRWEYYSPAKAPRTGGAANYDPSTGRLLIAGIGSVSNTANVRPYHRNFAPRFGFAYRLPGKTVVRGGYGISYTIHPFGGYGAFLSTNFPNISLQTAGSVGSSFPGGTLSQMIPSHVPPSPANGIFDPAPSDQAFYSLAFDTKFSYIQSYNLTVQRELLPGLSLDVSYVGNKGTNLFDNYHQLNYSPPGLGDEGGALFKRFGFDSSVLQAGFDANSNYNSLQVNLEKQMSRGLAFTAAYTWQRGIGYIHGPTFPAEFLKLGRGPDTNKMQFVTSQLWELPFGKGKSLVQSGAWAQILGGWQYNGIMAVYGGHPFSVLADPARLNGVRLDRNPADVVGPLRTPGGTGPGQLWFDTNSFAAPPVGRYGNSGAQLLYGPGFFNYDASLFRKFDFWNEKRLELRFEVFNVTNTPHWAQPKSNIDQPNFGQILSDSNDARRVQFGLRLLY